MKNIIIILFLFPFHAFTQVNDSFSDGNFTHNPTWTGDTSQFKVNTSYQLQLNSTVADTSYLSTASTSINNAEWDFWVKLSFQTSANNNARVYITSDRQNIKDTVSGYFVQVGEVNDSISLCVQSGVAITKIIHGIHANTNHTVNTLRIKVKRDNLGNWSLFSDTTGGTNFLLEGNGYDNTFSSSSYLGVWCKYTISNDKKFYFDDIYAGTIVVDTTPPVVNYVNVISSSQLDVSFSENVDTISAEDISNYSVNNSIGNPSTATIDGTYGNLVHLIFSSSFLQGITYTITTTNVQDLSNNTMLPDIRTFELYTAKEYDVVINEIMADPDPPVGLPNYEYAELYNRSSAAINLTNWTFKTGTDVKVFPTVILQPGSFLILTSTTAEPSFTTYGKVIGFSSFSLTNTGETLVLSDSSGHIIHTISYTDAWYQDSYKANGGWSLEQIDPNNPCGGEGNWRASNGILGGTPGTVNSINAYNPDNTTPQLVRVGLIDSSDIQLYFNEPMDSFFLQNILNYKINNGIGNPVNAKPVAPDYSSVILNFSPAIQTGIIYSVTVTDTMKDCSGNLLPLNTSARFAIPQIPAPGDIVINEVLSHPNTGGVNYVELYNRSDKIIDLKYLVLSTYDTINSVLTDVKDICDNGYLVFPKDYVVLTTDPSIVKAQYYTSNPNGFAQMTSLPAFDNDHGIVVIALKNSSLIIDFFSYTLGMYYPLLNSTSGVSLERINFDRPADDKTNWHSAAETVGFGTPAYKNSQYSDGEITDDPVSVSPEIFSPDNDGHDDVLNINYNFGVAGYLGTITIYDAAGRLIRSLIKSELLGTSGSFSWDGITNENEKARIGIYVIYFEVTDLKGNTKHYKKSAVLASKL